VNDQLTADSAAAAGDSPLKSGVAAEADARAKLRTQVEMLPLTRGMTLGEAAKQDERLQAAVERAIAHAPAKVQYQPGGSTRARISLDLHTLWNEISADR
jgi:hypothetical protein